MPGVQRFRPHSEGLQRWLLSFLMRNNSDYHSKLITLENVRRPNAGFPLNGDLVLCPLLSGQWHNDVITALRPTELDWGQGRSPDGHGQTHRMLKSMEAQSISVICLRPQLECQGQEETPNLPTCSLSPISLESEPRDHTGDLCSLPPLLSYM
jgi:hypothetical protein